MQNENDSCDQITDDLREALLAYMQDPNVLVKKHTVEFTTTQIPIDRSLARQDPSKHLHKRFVQPFS